MQVGSLLMKAPDSPQSAGACSEEQFLSTAPTKHQGLHHPAQTHRPASSPGRSTGQPFTGAGHLSTQGSAKQHH